MPGLHTYTLKSITSRLPYVQVFIIFLAFALMGGANYILGIRIENRHLEQTTEMMLNHIEDRLNSDLQELHTMLGTVSETIRTMIMHGADYGEVTRYISEMTAYGQEANISGFLSIFAMFDVFDWPKEGGFNGISPEADLAALFREGSYKPEEREWYKTAVEANGKTAITAPYMDIVTNEPAISYARCIFDNDGRRLAIIGMDIQMDRIYHFSSEQLGLGSHSWMLLDKNLTIIAYPFAEFIGMPLREAKGCGIENIANELEQGLTVSAREFVNPAGEKSSFSVWQLKNGLYMGISTPVESYYENLNSILFFVIYFGLLMASVLSAILLHIHAAKKKSDEMARKATEEKNALGSLESVMNGLDIMIYVTDPNTGEILFLNDSMKRHYSIEDDCIGQLCYKLLQKNKENKCDFCPCLQLNEDPGKAIVWEEFNTVTNRIYRNIDRYIDWPNGKTVHMQHSVDMTELVAAKEQAEQSSRYKSAFLATMSHEIRTPMNAILGIAEIQLQNKTHSPEIEEAFGKIYESGDLLLNIINDILDLSKIEAGRLELAPVNYDIPSLINDTAQLNRLRYESKPIVFTVHAEESLPLNLFGDELRIKQVLNNILSNAFKYTAKGGVNFTISSEHGQDDNVILVFRVSDTGQGMTEDQMGKLFDEYTRFNANANRTTICAGLGMSITKRLVNLLNGEISVESKVDSGSVFTVRIPQKCIGSEVCGIELTNNLQNFCFQSTSVIKKAHFMREYMPYGSVLIVDDVESNIYVTKGLLLPYGLRIDSASSGFEAIDKIKKGNVYDIIFMDHMMPQMDGIETVKIIRNMGYTRCIIALTANALIGHAQMFMENGFNGYISKPIDSREMNLLLNDFIRNKASLEVVEAARREYIEKEKKNNLITAQIKMSRIEGFFITDAEKTIKKLNELIENINAIDDAGITLYTVTVHGIKSALANIKEDELSGLAYKLEQAGKERNLEVISSETPAFINKLQSLVTKLKPEDNNITVISEEDAVLLRRNLIAIKTACLAFDKSTAKSALKDLKEKIWPKHINAVLDNIAQNILHSDFAKAAAIAEEFAARSTPIRGQLLGVWQKVSE